MTSCYMLLIESNELCLRGVTAVNVIIGCLNKWPYCQDIINLSHRAQP